ncbi:T0096617 isoform 4, partial [Pongo abelii]
LHPAEEGDFWAESSMLGLKITYFALMDGKVYDITEWAGCQRVGISPDTHRVPYHISFGSRIPGTRGRQRATPDAPPADLQDFLSRIFQVPPGQMPNGNFFAAPQPAPGATAASKPNSTVPKGEAKPKRRKKSSVSVPSPCPWSCPKTHPSVFVDAKDTNPMELGQLRQQYT